MWLLPLLLIVAQSDDILKDAAGEGKTAPPAATAAAQPEPAKAAEPAPATGAKQPEQAADAAATSDVPAAPKTPEQSGLAKVLSDLTQTGALGYMIRGGIFMWPLLAMGILALGVIIERTRALVMMTGGHEELRGQVRELLQADRAEEAVALCERQQGPVPAILGAGLRKYLVLRRLDYDPGKIEEQVVKAMEDYSVHVVAALERHLPILATISSAAPMIGFLGTVQGMVISFEQIVARSREGTQIVELAAEGIMVSLLTTVLGLIVGIPAFIAFNYFTSVINRFVLDVEGSASELIEAVTLQQALAGREMAERNGQAAVTRSEPARSV